MKAYISDTHVLRLKVALYRIVTTIAVILGRSVLDATVIPRRLPDAENRFDYHIVKLNNKQYIMHTLTGI